MSFDLKNMQARIKPRDDKSMIQDTTPDFPFGLRLHLDKEQMAILGMAELPEVDSKVMIHAKAFVSFVSESKDSEGEVNMHFDLQITDMALLRRDDPTIAVRPAQVAADPADILFNKA